METLAERSQSTLQWLLVLGAVSAWAMFDRPPRVIEGARELVDGCLANPRQLGIEGDLLAALPPAAAAPLKQYRHEYLRPGMSDRQWHGYERQALAPLTIRVALELGRKTIELVDQGSVSGVTEQLVVSRLRSRLAWLESCQQRSGLSEAATMSEVEHALRSRLPIPGTDHTVPLDHCMLFAAVGLIALQLLLVSLLATTRALIGRREMDYSCVVFHSAPWGPLLTRFWIAGPALAWLLQALVRPAAYSEWPPVATAVLGALLLVTTVLALQAAKAARRAVLAAAQEQAGALQVIARAAA